MKVTSILTKVFMAITGLAWLGFLIGHLIGNLQLFAGRDGGLHEYGLFLKGLGHGAAIPLVEVGLIAFLLAHMFAGFRTHLANKNARKQGYAVSANAGESSLASRTMIVGGFVIFVFIVVHIVTIKLQWNPSLAEGEPNQHLWVLTVTTLKNPLWGGFYFLSMIPLGMHLSHGFGSAFQTLGILRSDLRETFRTVGRVFGWLIAVGFMSFPVWALLVAKVN